MANINDYTDIDSNLKSLKRLISTNNGLIQNTPYNPIVSEELSTSNFVEYFDNTYGGDDIDLCGYDTDMYGSDFDNPRIPPDMELEDDDDLTRCRNNTEYSDFDNGETSLVSDNVLVSAGAGMSRILHHY
jgi:hypothetical protein